jgi:hypothetical protein
MTSLTLKRAAVSRRSGQWQHEDYDVLADGKVIGRILEEGSRFGPPELRWGWLITESDARTPEHLVSSGRSVSSWERPP